MADKTPQETIPNTPFRFILFALKPYRWRISIAVIFVFLSQLFAELGSYALRGIIDSAHAFTSGDATSQAVLLWVLSIPALIILATASIRSAGFVFNYVTVRARTGALKSLFAYISLHSLAYYSDQFSGALSSRVSTISGNVSRLLRQFVWSILATLFALIIALILIASSSVTLALVFLSGFIVLIPINIIIARKQIALSELMARTAAKLRGQVIDVLGNISAVQHYARRTHEIERLNETIEEHRVADTRSDNYRERVLFINNLLVSLFVGIIVVWSFFVWLRGSITIGEFVMIITLVRGFIGLLTRVGQNINNMLESYGEVKDGLEELIVPHDIVDASDAQPLNITQTNIDFKAVTFSYEDKQEKVFKDLTFSIKNREKVGIVGTSGAGKKTLMKLLLRQHDVGSGTISINGTDITTVKQESLRNAISIVPQEPVLFHRSIRENILYGKLDATDEEMITVAKKAQAHDFIVTLRDGYDSLVGERGVKLSVGQRQRIAIARAFLKNAPILVLDEATSALDSESEVAVQKALHNLMEGKTVLAIAHRLSTLREMDRIIVFKEGVIAEDGTHAELLKNNTGVYASLWEHQVGGFINEDIG